MNRCAVVCASLIDMLQENEYKLRLHSAFRHAANLSSSIGMITLLAPGKGVQPFSAVLDHPFPFAGLPEEEMRITSAGIFWHEERLFSFEGAEQKYLQSDFCRRWSTDAPDHILGFLANHKEKGLAEMAFGEQSSIYADFLRPKLDAFRMAAKLGKEEDIVLSAWGMAGCGMGLTPSSDDLLCGYLAGMLPIWPEGLLQRTAQKAASRTNDISASLLCHAGAGRFSQDILTLMDCLEKECPAGERQKALEQVASFGSSSGCDFLTGLYFGIVDAREISEDHKYMKEE